jgi:hypothetical protein
LPATRAEEEGENVNFFWKMVVHHFFKKVLNSTFSKNLDAFNFILGMVVEYF